MGRMFDAFDQARTRRGTPETFAPSLHTVWPDEAGAPGGADEEEMPFIEVGGPRGPATGAVAIALPLPAAPPLLKMPLVEVGPRLMSIRFRPLAPSVQPLTRVARELVALHQPEHAISGQYRELAASLLAQAPATQPRVLLFTSSGTGVGTTTVVLNAAITLAKQGKLKVIVVDAHLRRPAVGDRLGLSAGPGLREVLAGRMPAEEAVQVTALPGLAALTAGEAEGVAAARLAGETMRSVLGHLRDHFDLVLVDGPRWDGRPELVALGCACDAVYLCLPEAEQAADETMQVLIEQGAPLRGCILTSR